MPEANDRKVGIMPLVAQTEREVTSTRTKEALSAAKARGVKLGNTNELRAYKDPEKEERRLERLCQRMPPPSIWYRCSQISELRDTCRLGQ